MRQHRPRLRDIVLALIGIGVFAVSAGAQNAGTSPAAADVVHRAGEPGLTLPKVVKDVKPRYTPEAMAAKITGSVLLEAVVLPNGTVGDVRVVRSLDSTNGLDNEAVTAAKQWVFSPGTRNGEPVAVLVSIQLTFALGDQPAATGAWPAPFPGAPPPPPIATTQWKQDTFEANGVRVSAAYPTTWSVAPAPPGTLLMLQHTRSRSVAILQISAAAVELPSALTTAERTQFADKLKSVINAGGHVDVRATGEVQINNQPWVWADLWMSADQLQVPEAERKALMQTVAGVRGWAFTSLQNSRELLALCWVAIPRAVPDDEVVEELTATTATFSEMIKRLKVEAP